MVQPLRLGVFGLLCVLLLAACDDGTVSDLDDRTVRNAVTEASDPVAALKPYVGMRVRWSGTVLGVEKSFEDDFIEVARVLIDLDEPKLGEPAVADVSFSIPPDTADDLPRDRPITFVGKIRELDRGVRPPRILLEATIDNTTTP